MVDLPLMSSSGFVTIDDTVYLADELATRLHQLSQYKHPLAVRKGVIAVADKPDRKKQESMQVKGAGRTYFLDIQETKAGKPYLVVTESRKAQGEATGEGEQWRRVSLSVFPEDAEAFSSAVRRMTLKLHVHQK